MVLTLAVFWLLPPATTTTDKTKSSPHPGLLKRKVVFSIAIKEYSRSRDSTRQLSPSFRVREFGCKGSDVVQAVDPGSAALSQNASVVVLVGADQNVTNPG